jgi:hypothetical protein
MRMKRFAAWLLAAGLALAGCEDGAPERNVTKLKVANPYSDQLKGMSELYRNLGLLRAIKDAGRRCKKVDAAAYQEEYKNLAMWVARCTDTGDFAVFIGPAADVQVSPCKDASTLDLPVCRPLPAAKEEKAAR